MRYAAESIRLNSDRDATAESAAFILKYYLYKLYIIIYDLVVSRVCAM